MTFFRNTRGDNVIHYRTLRTTCADVRNRPGDETPPAGSVRGAVSRTCMRGCQTCDYRTLTTPPHDVVGILHNGILFTALTVNSTSPRPDSMSKRATPVPG